MTDKAREVFETMSKRFRISAECLRQDEDGCYLDKETQSYWVVFGIAWAESREALVIELPEPFAYVGDYAACGGRRILVRAENTDRMCRKIPVYDRAAIEAAGVKVKP